MVNFLNRCIWNAAASGTVDFVVSGAAQNGYSPAQCANPIVINGATYRYFATNGAEHEEGDGVYTVGTTTLTRATVRNSSAAGAKVSFTAPPVVAMGGPVANDMSAGGGMAIGGAVASGTTGSILFVAGGNLAQDNSKFFWDDTNFALKISGTNALFKVPASPDNWFMAGAGNATTTGNGNVGIGDTSLAAVTTGSSNMGLGGRTMDILTTGSANTAIGVQALDSLTTGSYNVAIGSTAASSVGVGGGNTAIGFAALKFSTGGSNNVAIGGNSFTSLTGTNSSNTGIGNSVYNQLVNGIYNVGIGASALPNITAGNSNVVVGTFAGFNANGTSNYNTLIGGWNFPNTSAVSNVIALTDGVDTQTGDGKCRGVDFNYTTAGVWSFQYMTTPIGLRVYNTTDSAAPPTNYERAVFDWNITSNTLTIGTQAGGTGTVRPIKWAGLSNKTTPISGDHVLLLDSVTSDAMKTATVASIAGTGSISIGSAVGSGTSGSMLFVDGSGNLAQNNSKLFWDNTNFILKISGQNALFQVPNGGGDNWFAAESGITTVTGTNNYGFGRIACNSLTTGSSNVGVGAGACQFVTSGGNNVAVGFVALEFCTTGNSNVAIGTGAMQNCVDGVSNFALGTNALQSLTTGAAQFNVAIGASTALILAGASNSNTFVGGNAAPALTSGNQNTWIGDSIGHVWASGGHNTIIGSVAAFNITSGDNNTILGPWLGPSSAVSDVIAIADGGNNLRLDYNFTTANTWTFPRAICVTPVATASLPAAGAPGRRHFVTDANSTTFAAIVAGGGTNKIPVYDDGTNWRIG